MLHDGGKTTVALRVADTDRVLFHAGGRPGRRARRRGSVLRARVRRSGLHALGALAVPDVLLHSDGVRHAPRGQMDHEVQRQPRSERVVRARCGGGGRYGLLYSALAMVDIGRRVRVGGQLHIRGARSHPHRQLVPCPQGLGAGGGHVVLGNRRRGPRACVHAADSGVRLARGVLHRCRHHGPARFAMDAVRVQAPSRGRGREALRLDGRGRAA